MVGVHGRFRQKIYPYQMWPDSIYMASPFYAEFGKTFGEPAAFDDGVGPFILASIEMEPEGQ